MVGVPHSGAFQTPEILRTCSDEDVMQMKFRRADLDSEIAQVATRTHVLKGLEIHELLDCNVMQQLYGTNEVTRPSTSLRDTVC